MRNSLTRLDRKMSYKRSLCFASGSLKNVSLLLCVLCIFFICSAPLLPIHVMLWGVWKWAKSWDWSMSIEAEPPFSQSLRENKNLVYVFFETREEEEASVCQHWCSTCQASERATESSSGSHRDSSVIEVLFFAFQASWFCLYLWL